MRAIYVFHITVRFHHLPLPTLLLTNARDRNYWNFARVCCLPRTTAGVRSLLSDLSDSVPLP